MCPARRLKKFPQVFFNLKGGMMQNWRHTDFKYVVEIQKGFVKQSSQSTSQRSRKCQELPFSFRFMIYLFFAEPKSQQCLAGTAIGQAHQSWAIYHLMQPLLERWQPMVFKETSFEKTLWFSHVLLLYFNRIQSEVKNTFMKEFQHADFQIGMNSKKTKNLRLFGVDFYSSNKSFGASLRSRYRRTTISHWMTFSK